MTETNMSVDGSRQSMEGVGVGSAGPTEDEEGRSGLPAGDLRYDPNAGDCESGKGETEEEDYWLREAILIDDDQEAEEEQECLPDFAELRGGAPSDGGVESYAELTEAIFDGLPSEEKVLDSVTLGVQEACTEHKVFLAPLARDLLGLAVVQTFVRDWWRFLVKIIVDNADQPPTSARAGRFTRARREARQEEAQRFIRHDDIRAQASTLPDGREIEETLTQALHNANFVKAVYPTYPHGLDAHRRRTLYHIMGWLLRSALTRLARDVRKVPAFLSFVNTHKYDTAEEFRDAHPDEEYRGLEAMVEERNVKWEGESLVFPSAQFFEFGLAVEAGYRHTMENRALLATYHGDLASEVLEMVCTAEPVKLAWARCAELVTDDRGGGGGQGWGTATFEELFDFVMEKWHNCRMYEYTRGLKYEEEEEQELKRTKKATAGRDDMPPRDQTKVSGGSSSGNAPFTGKAKKKPPPPPITEEHRARAAELARTIGCSEFRNLTPVQVREYIAECGVYPPTSLKKLDLQSLLRSLAPGVGMDADY